MHSTSKHTATLFADSPKGRRRIRRLLGLKETVKVGPKRQSKARAIAIARERDARAEIGEFTA